MIGRPFFQMPIVEVVTIKGHSPDGIKRYKVGDRYRITEKSAKLLILAKFVQLAIDQPEEMRTPKETTRYNRRDMRAKD